MNVKTYFSSRKGFTLIELLVVIGILAVLAAIAIPSVAGLIDRANVSADKTNANEMTNAVERFTSEYELYCQDIASGVIKDADSNGVPDDMDAAQGRVFNVTGAVTRSDITALESTGLDGMQINRDTKYPVNAETMQAIVENYTKTSSSTFEPKQSDMHYWYSPDCGVVVYATPDADVAEDLNSQIQSGMDAKGNKLDENTEWIDLTANITEKDNSEELITGATFNDGTFLTWEELKLPENGTKYGYNASAITDTDISYFAFASCPSLTSITIPDSIIVIDSYSFSGCGSLASITIPDSVTSIGFSAFSVCNSLTTVAIGNGVTTIDTNAFGYCENLTAITISDSVTTIGMSAFSNCYSLASITFSGTKAQWNAITLEQSWNHLTLATAVHCTDGDVTIYPTN